MPRRSVIVSTVTCLIVLIIACSAFAQERGQGQRGAAPPTRAPLFLKEEWKQTPAGGEHPVDIPTALSNPNLELRSMLLRDQAAGCTVDMLTSDLAVYEMRWRKLDPARLVTVGDWVASPNLSRIDEIGFVDLIPGSGHGQGGWSDVAQIEIY